MWPISVRGKGGLWIPHGLLGSEVREGVDPVWTFRVRCQGGSWLPCGLSGSGVLEGCVSLMACRGQGRGRAESRFVAVSPGGAVSARGIWRIGCEACRHLVHADRWPGWLVPAGLTAICVHTAHGGRRSLCQPISNQGRAEILGFQIREMFSLSISSLFVYLSSFCIAKLLSLEL